MAVLVGAISAIGSILAHSITDFNLHIPANTLVIAMLFAILANPTEAPDEGAEAAAPVRIPLWMRLAPGLACLALCVTAARFVTGEYFCERARVALRDADYPATIAYGAKAVEREKLNPDLYYYIGEAHRFLALESHDLKIAADEYEKAVEAFRNGLKLYPHDIRIELKLAITLDASQRSDDADAMFQQALADDPNFGNVYALYGFHLQLQHRTKRAEEYYKIANKLQESEISVAGLRDLERERNVDAASQDVFAAFVSKPDEDEDDPASGPPVQPTFDR